MTKIFILLTLILASCTFKKNALKNQIQEGHEELYSEPSSPKSSSLDDEETRIVIASTNDVHGNLNPVSEPYGIRLGGGDVLGQYIKILRNQFKEIVLVDSGDFLPSDTQEMSSVHNFYETLNYDAVTVGLDDFNLKVPKNMNSSIDLFQEFTKTSTPPLVLSNLFQLKTGRTVEWEGSKPYLLKEIDGVKVGILGLVAHDVVNKTPIHNRTGLFVEDMVQSTLRHARLLRSLGADVIVVITHDGINCGETLAEAAKLPLTKVNFEPRASKVCDLNSDMGLFLERLPPHLVDVVIGGRTPLKTVNYVNETLVLTGLDKGRSLNYVEFVVNKNTHKVVKSKTVVHQPVMTCHEFFKSTNDCYTEDPTVDHSKKVPAKFLGTEIVPDIETKSAQAPEAMDPAEINEVMLASAAQIAYVPLSSGHSQLVTLEISGSELRKILEEEYNHSHTTQWWPMPFDMRNDGLHFVINKESISGEKTYKVLSDVESMMGSPYFRKIIATSAVTTIPNSSWKSQEVHVDEIQSVLAAPETSTAP